MNILVVGEWLSSNLGDGVIGNVCKQIIKEKIPGANIIMFDLTLRKDYDRSDDINDFFSIVEQKKRIISEIDKRFFNSRIYNKNIREDAKRIAQAFERCVVLNKPDAIIFGGGQMFLDYFIYKIECIIEIATRYSIPVYFNACGVANKLDETIKGRISGIIGSSIVKRVSMRDGAELFASDKIIKTFDTAILTKQFYPPKQKNHRIGIGIMYASNYSINMQKKMWLKIIGQLQKANIPFYVFTNGNRDDYSFAMHILQTKGIKTELNLVGRPKCPEDLIEIISQFDFVISMRLHSLLLAYSFQIPGIAIAWDEKVSSFYQMAGINQHCYTVNSKINIPEALQKLKDDRYYFAQKEEIEKTIIQVLTEMCYDITCDLNEQRRVSDC